MDNLIHISSFYKFTPLGALEHCRAMQQPLKREMLRKNIRGTITLAPEGINATIAGAPEPLESLIDYLHDLPGVGQLDCKLSQHASQPFKRTKVKVKPELISLGEPADPTICVGEYIAPKDWNALMTREDVITIDTRNDYEYRIGHFKDALNPNTSDFKEMVAFTQSYLDTNQHKSVAMYCTGGIRCEKYSSYLLSCGFEHVYHLKGGVLQYLQDVASEDSLWEGACFVFDDRVAVKHDLSKDEQVSLCFGCGNPLTPEDRAYEAFFNHRRCGYCRAA